MNRIFATILGVTLICLMPAISSAAALVAKVDVSSQTMTVIHNGQVAYQWPVSTARKGKYTPRGSWSAKWLSKNHKSSLYNNAPMPWTLRLTWDGVAIHGGSTVELGYASHGCIGVPDEFISRLYDIAKTGDVVIITDGQRANVGSSLAAS